MPEHLHAVRKTNHWVAGKIEAINFAIYAMVPSRLIFHMTENNRGSLLEASDIGAFAIQRFTELLLCFVFDNNIKFICCNEL